MGLKPEKKGKKLNHWQKVVITRNKLISVGSKMML